MRIRKKIDFAKVFLYLFCGVGMVCLAQIGNNAEPFSLPLFYGMASAGLSPILSAFFYLLSALPSWNLTVILLYAGQAVLVSIGFYVQRKLKKTDFFKTGFVPLLCLSLSLGLFFPLAPFTPYIIPLAGIKLNTLTQRVILAALTFLLSAIFSVAMKALLHKLLKCRLRDDEVVFSLLLLVLIGIGFCRFFSVNAYMGAAFLILLLYSCATKDSSITVCAFVLSTFPPPVFSSTALSFPSLSSRVELPLYALYLPSFSPTATSTDCTDTPPRSWCKAFYPHCCPLFYFCLSLPPLSASWKTVWFFTAKSTYPASPSTETEPPSGNSYLRFLPYSVKLKLLSLTLATAKRTKPHARTFALA